MEIKRILVIVFFLPLTLFSEDSMKWEYQYQKDVVYHYSLRSSVDKTYQKISVDGTGFNGRIGPEVHTDTTIDALFILKVKSVKKNEVHFICTLEDLKIEHLYREDTPKELNAAIHPSNATLGEEKKLTLENKAIDSKSFNGILTKTGGFKIKDKMKFLKSSFGKDVKKFSKKNRDLEKDLSYILTGQFWQNFLTWHFISLNKKSKVPSKEKRTLELFLDPKHPFNKLNNVKACPLEYVSLIKNNYKQLVLGAKFDVSYINSIPGAAYHERVSAKTQHKDKFEYFIDEKGHLYSGPYELWFSAYTGNQSFGDQLTINIASSLQFIKLFEKE